MTNTGEPMWLTRNSSWPLANGFDLRTGEFSWSWCFKSISMASEYVITGNGLLLSQSHCFSADSQSLYDALDIASMSSWWLASKFPVTEQITSSIRFVTSPTPSTNGSSASIMKNSDMWILDVVFSALDSMTFTFITFSSVELEVINYRKAGPKL